MPRKKNPIAQVAAAAAAAAVKEAKREDNVVHLKWDDDASDDEDELQSEVLQGLERINEEGGGEIRWELYCDVPLDKRGQIREMAPEELRGVRNECLSYGPGEYHVVARKIDGTFVRKSRAKIKISKLTGGVNTVPIGPPLDPNTLIQQIEERAEKRRADERAARREQMQLWGTILSPIAVKLAESLFHRSGDSIKDMVGALVGMKDLMGGNDKQVETLLKGMELAREMAPEAKGSTWPDILASTVKEIRPLAEGLVNRRNGTAPANPGPVQPAQLQFQTAPAQPAATADNGPQTPASPNSAPEQPAMWNMARPLLQKLAVELEEYAVNGAEPGLAAEALWAKVPRLLRAQVSPEQLREWLTQGDWWAITVQFHPPLSSYQGFVDDVRLTLLEMVEEQIKPAPDQAAEGGESA